MVRDISLERAPSMLFSNVCFRDDGTTERAW